MKKKLVIGMVLLFFASLLTACGSKSSSTSSENTQASSALESLTDSSDAEESSESEGTTGSESEHNGAPIEVREEIRTSLEAAQKIAGYTAICSDGTFISDESDLEEIMSFYRTLDLKTLTLPETNEPYLALATDGKLYYGTTMCAENIEEITYYTKRQTPGIASGFAIGTNGTVYELNSEHLSNVLTVEERPDIGKITNISYMNSSKNNYVIIYKDGTVEYMPDGNSAEDWAEYDISGWKDIALFALQKYRSPEADQNESTVVAVSGDGTVYATGTHAEEVLSWGPLRYIDACSDTIVGVTMDGELKVTGRSLDYFFATNDLSAWNKILAVEATEAGFTAVDTEGGVYFMEDGYVKYYNKESGQGVILTK
ncbi:MAG: hypothetical protein Q4B26_01930 [Eubacteriales bacterium]|nr:hypothetical protein [Eubacteriales bacterium]